MISLYNITESMAQQALEQIVLDKMVDGQDISSFCFCPRCWLDMLSLALTNLPPHYVVSAQGEVLTRVLMMDQQTQAQISTEITKALLQVGANPRHEIPLRKM